MRQIAKKKKKIPNPTKLKKFPSFPIFLRFFNHEWGLIIFKYFLKH